MLSLRTPHHRPVHALIVLILGVGGLAATADDTTKPAADAGARSLGLPLSEYQSRRRELMQRVRTATQGPNTNANANATPFRRSGGSRPVIVLRGADDPDIEARFRQTNDFAYLTGVDVPGAYLVLDPAADREVLYLPPSTAPGLSASRPGPGPETATRFGLQRVVSTSALLADLFGAIGDTLVSPHGSSRAIVYLRTAETHEEGPEPRLERLLRAGAPSTAFRDLKPILAAMRKRKSPAELEPLRTAIAITADAQRAVMRTLRPGRFEHELEGAILGAFVAGGAERPGFPSIVGSGPNSTIPHYFDNHRKIEDGDLVVVDIGAEYQLYTADITRTYPASGRFTDRQRAIYQVVLDAQKAVEDEMKPGKTRLADMTRFTRDYFKKVPLRAKDESGAEQTLDHFFIHGLGHYLGMDVHDVGSYSEPVQIGEVFTIEPGLYIKSEALGVRIEDDYVMTEQGPEKLSKALPSNPEDIEKAMARE